MAKKSKKEEGDKVVTFKLKGPGGFIIGTDPIDLIIATFGCIEGGSSIDPDEKESLFGALEKGESYKYTITVEKRYTEADLEKMAESDGDIH